jgi:hypothetical protein
MWKVQLVGDKSDFEALAQVLKGSDVNISYDGRDWVLTSDRFLPDDTPRAVLDKGNEIVTTISGASRLALNSTEPIKAGGVLWYRADGKRDAFIFPEPGVIRLRSMVSSVQIVSSDGTAETFYAADPVKDWATLALRDASAAKVLKILAGGLLNWVNLYLILEIIGEDVGGLDRISDKGWASKTDVRLFKHTANSPQATGLESRHGASSNQPPPAPMRIEDAQKLVNGIIEAWLRSKS